MYEIKHSPIEDLLQETLEYNLYLGDNFYITESGNKVPRVTSILSETSDSTGLIKWANSIGLKGNKYEEVLNNAADIGTKAHSDIESFIKSIMTGSTPPNNMDSKPYLSFISWWSTITKCNRVMPLYSEETLHNDYFGGTPDLILDIEGKVYLVDFKTSNSIREKYFLQLAAYRMLIYQKLNINIDGVIILQLNKYYNKYTEYVLDFSIPEHYKYIEDCHRTFLSMVYTYYNMHNIRRGFSELFING